jgi:ankyrin repeat protein
MKRSFNSNVDTLKNDVTNAIITNEMVEKAIKDDNIFEVFKLVSAPKEINRIDFNMKNKDGETLLSLCVNPELKNCLPFIFFKSRELWYIRDKTGLTPTMNMILKNDNLLFLIEIFDFPKKYLLDMFTSAIHEDNVYVVEAILNKMYPTRYDDTYQINTKTLLMIACQNENENIVRMLLVNNSQHINILTQNNQNALMLACKYSNALVVQDLLEYKANIYQKSRGGMTALMIACNKKPSNKIKDDVEIVEHLLKYSDETYINQQNYWMRGYNALMFAVVSNNLQIVRCLLKTGRCDVNIINNKGESVWEMIDINNEEMKEVFKPYFETEQVFKKIKLNVEETKEKEDKDKNKDDNKDEDKDEDDDKDDDEDKDDDDDEDEDDKDKDELEGLQIGNANLKRISGPMSITILVPKNDQIGVDGQIHHINDYQHQKISENSLPAIILFGDYHRSSSGMCEDCDDDEDCCSIYSNYFLQLLDSLYVNGKTPIDFYVEVGKPNFKERDVIFDRIKKKYLYTHYNSNSEYPLRRIVNFKSCYIRELRNTDLYKKKCPTKKVRWHGIDARYSNSYEHIIQNFIELFFNYDNPVYNLYISYLIVNSLTRQEIIFYLNQIADFINEPELFIAKMFNLETNPVLRYNSLIYKQISKMRPPLNDYGWWYKMFCELYKYIFLQKIIKVVKIKNLNDDIETLNKFLLKKISNTDTNEVIFSRVCNYISYAIKNKIIPIIKEDSSVDIFDRMSALYFSIFENIMYPIKNWSNIFYIQLSTIFLDMYFITRVFKFPENGNPSVLTLGYFGDAHCESITHFLTQIIQIYDIIYVDQHNNYFNNDFRCLYLPDLDFNSTIFNFKLLKSLSSSQGLREISQVVKEYEENQTKRKEKAQKSRSQVLKLIRHL